MHGYHAILAKAIADIHELQQKVQRLEHFVETRVPLALLRAAELLGEKDKIASQQTLGTLEQEFSRLNRENSNGTKT